MRADVSFPSAGLELAGHLYIPDGESGGPRPGIVVSHPAAGVKEQAAGLYADRLAREGFVTLAFERPLLMIVGREAATSYMTSESFWKAQEPKELFWIDGATDVALYDKEEYVTPAMAKLAEFFGSHLTTTTCDSTRMTAA